MKDTQTLNRPVVCKFGGTSLANSQNIRRVCDIIKSDPRRRIIIVSAPGKRNSGDKKITDILFEIFHAKEAGADFDTLYKDFEQRFFDIERDFGLKGSDLKQTMEEFYSEIKTGSCDFITSTGEYFMAKVMAAILGFEFVDIDKTRAICFKTVRQERPRENKYVVDLAQSKKNLAPFLDKKIVIPGFYGVTPLGSIFTFSRGGSDITGAIVANLADAAVYENWTDVDGVYDKDPNKFPDAKHFAEISYNQVEDLARGGANVLHPDCINYVKEKNIPINLKNTFNPSAPGTIIK